MIRDDIQAAMIAAMKARDTVSVGALRLMMSTIKNRDIELRIDPKERKADEDDPVILDILQKMIKQRRDSIEMYRQGGRTDLAEAEAAEIEVIQRFLPKPMDEAETAAAIDSVLAELGTTSITDMGIVMKTLKARYAGRLDMPKVMVLVKARLG